MPWQPMHMAAFSSRRPWHPAPTRWLARPAAASTKIIEIALFIVSEGAVLGLAGDYGGADAPAGLTELSRRHAPRTMKFQGSQNYVATRT
jgi:hypothetical protein